MTRVSRVLKPKLSMAEIAALELTLRLTKDIIHDDPSSAAKTEAFTIRLQLLRWLKTQLNLS